MVTAAVDIPPEILIRIILVDICEEANWPLQCAHLPAYIGPVFAVSSSFERLDQHLRGYACVCSINIDHAKGVYTSLEYVYGVTLVQRMLFRGTRYKRLVHEHNGM